MMFSSVCGYAANTISYPETTILSGEIVDIPVEITIDGDYDSLKLDLIFNNRIIDIKSIKEANNLDAKVNYSIAHRLDTGELSLSFAKKSGNKINLIFRTEGLTYYKNEAIIKIASFIINDQYAEFVQNTNKTLVIGDKVQQGTPYNLMQNYPNPFNDHTTFNFSIDADGEVNFKVYNLVGMEVLNNANITPNMKLYKMIIGGGEEAISDGIFNLKKGKYRLDFNPIKYYFPSGVYYFTITVNNVFLSKPFIFSR